MRETRRSSPQRVFGILEGLAETIGGQNLLIERFYHLAHDGSDARKLRASRMIIKMLGNLLPFT